MHAYVQGTTLISNSLIEVFTISDTGLSIEPETEVFSQDLFGVANGGSVTIVVEGLAFVAITIPGQAATAVLTDLAGQINATPALAHVNAQVAPPSITLLAPIDSFTVEDAGLNVGVAVPLFDERVLTLLLLLLLASGVHLSRLGKVQPRSGGKA